LSEDISNHDKREISVANIGTDNHFCQNGKKTMAFIVSFQYVPFMSQ
jgi:hypothetical protein